jgi:hypothetical protein
LVLVGVLVVFMWPRGAKVDGVHVVDVAAPIAAARQQSGFAVLAPRGLSDQWRPTSTRLIPTGPSSGASFRIGYVSPSGKYAELVESNDAPDAVAAEYGPLAVAGTTVIGGTSWQQYRTNDDRRLLRHTAARVTVIVTGSASQSELIELASSLH